MARFRILSTAIVCLVAASACTSSGGNQVDNTLSTPQAVTAHSSTAEPGNATALAETQQPSAAENVTNSQLQQPTQQAALSPTTAVTFLPVQGAPQDKVSLLSKSLKTSAANYQLSLLPTTQDGSAYQVKGYFSALSDGSGTLLVYIWDVLDRSGKRLHRINGQERASATNFDPWQAITDAELGRVADTTAARLKSWIDSQPRQG